ncbi:MAG: 23S rRNA (uracil(1939)-C(5))-methyltransferase RlmD [Lautropia sp.]|nr:23S rRNA (uracil(1939)-C(5))-methyltransferase RlmD [Lautropia sp.]
MGPQSDAQAPQARPKAHAGAGSAQVAPGGGVLPSVSSSTRIRQPGISTQPPRIDVPAEPLQCRIESVDLDGHGIARHEGKVVFVHGGLPGELVEAKVTRAKPRYLVAEVLSVQEANPNRRAPRCPHYGVCGGCNLQHADVQAQVAYKQRVLEDTLWHLGKVRAAQMLPPIEGPGWGYRFRARLTVRDVPTKGGVLVGFHEKSSSYVAPLSQCPILPPQVSALLPGLKTLIESLSIRQRLPQVEVAVGDCFSPRRHPLALVFRVLLPPSKADLQQLMTFGQAHGAEIWLQPGGPGSIELLVDAEGRRDGVSALAYELPEFGVRIPFGPTDFTQVNAGINRVLLARAVRMLDLAPDDRVVDLFCGLGNFTLPLGTLAREVIGVEGVPALVARGERNAELNRQVLLAPPGESGVRFQTANLFEFDLPAWQALGRVDKLLIDPPRDGALAVAKVLAALPSASRPARMVYVSCNPATLARDLGIMVHEGGWRVRQAGVANMFPHTAHVESIALIEPA